ncbi:hypothetical protein VZG28_13720 [Synechococcus elongatus IITB4]|uniref:hypothetical protein n=1 Tax=Synechococcus elongatus TaxID=32046 RepID=UPI0030D3CE9F
MSHPVTSLSPQTDRWLAPLAIALFIWQSSGQDAAALLQDWEAIAADLWHRQPQPAPEGIETLPCRYLQRGVALQQSSLELLPELSLLWAIAQRQDRNREVMALELADLGRRFGTVILPLHWWRSLPQARLQFLCQQLGAWQAGYRQPPMQQGVN